jgi:hypothetical protein
VALVKRLHQLLVKQQACVQHQCQAARRLEMVTHTAGHLADYLPLQVGHLLLQVTGCCCCCCCYHLAAGRLLLLVVRERCLHSCSLTAADAH